MREVTGIYLLKKLAFWSLLLLTIFLYLTK